MNGADQNNEDGLKAPEPLVAELKRVASTDLFIPRAVDDAVLLAARNALQPENPPRLFRLRLLPWLTAATAVLILALSVWFRPFAHRPVIASGDVNHDGRVDILDAFVLARELKAPAHPGATLDINGDGIVDQRDVTTLAARAVQLEKGGG